MTNEPKAADSDAAHPRRALQYTNLLLAVLIGCVVPLVIARQHGALNIPRSDDWSYLRTLFRWSETGRWDFNGWVSMTLVGQIVLTRPVVEIFGASIAAVRVFTACLGALGLVATFGTARMLGVRAERAGLIALCVAATPLWGSLVNTYMTDVPAFALQACAMWCAVRAMRTRRISIAWLVVAVMMGVYAVAIRQYAGVTLVAILAIGTWLAHRENRLSKTTMWFITGAAGAACAAIVAVAGAIPNPQTLSPTIPNASSVQIAFESAGGFARMAGLFLLPLIVLANPMGLVRAARATDRQLASLMGSGAALILAFSYFLNPNVPFVGNYFARQGVLADDIVRGTRPDVIPSVVFDLLAIIGSLSALILVMAMVPFVARCRHHCRAKTRAPADGATAMLGLSLIGLFAAYELAIMVNFPLFDRYFIPAIPLIAMLFVQATQRPQMLSTQPERAARVQPRVATGARFGAVAAMIALAAVGWIYTDESASYDGARWKAGMGALQAGYTFADINAGYEWVGFRLDRSPPFRLIAKPEAFRRATAKRYLKGLCVSVVISDRGKPKNVVAQATSEGIWRDPVTVYARRLPDTACARGLAAERRLRP